MRPMAGLREEVAEGVEAAVAEAVGDGEGALVEDPDEAGRVALGGDVGGAVRRPTLAMKTKGAAAMKRRLVLVDDVDDLVERRAGAPRR